MKPVVVAKLPTVGDVVTGQIETAQSSVSNLKIYYVNGMPDLGRFRRPHLPQGGEGWWPRDEEDAGEAGDIVRAKVVSTVNAMIHLSIGEPHLGVVATLCSNCGSPLSDEGGRAQCNNCGNQEDRKFADDFGRQPIQP